LSVKAYAQLGSKTRRFFKNKTHFGNVRTMEIAYKSSYTYWKMFLNIAVSINSFEVLAGS